jgi:hypothetical protein
MGKSWDPKFKNNILLVVPENGARAAPGTSSLRATDLSLQPSPSRRGNGAYAAVIAISAFLLSQPPHFSRRPPHSPRRGRAAPILFDTTVYLTEDSATGLDFAPAPSPHPSPTNAPIMIISSPSPSPPPPPQPHSLTSSPPLLLLLLTLFILAVTTTTSDPFDARALLGSGSNSPEPRAPSSPSSSSSSVLCTTHSASTSAPLLSLPPNLATRPRSDKRQIRVFVVVFQRHQDARNLVEEMLKSDLTSFSFEIVVLCNFETFSFPADDPLFSANADNLAVLNNFARPSFSYGHLARDWNTAALFGFADLANPISDVVVGVQADVSLLDGWASRVYSEHTKGATLFLQAGRGDAFHSWTAEGVRRIGLWDERFTDVGYQDGDMFLRALILEPDRVRIGDFHHGRVHRAPDYIVVGENGAGDRGGSTQRHRHSGAFWAAKWGGRPYTWALETNASWFRNLAPAVPSSYVYPFFEWKLDGPVERLWFPYEMDPTLDVRTP